MGSQLVEGFSDKMLKIGDVGVYIRESHFELSVCVSGCWVCLSVLEASEELLQEYTPDIVHITLIIDLLDPL